MAQATDPKVKEAILKELAGGKSVPQAAKDHGVKEPTIYSWKKKKKRTKASAAKKAAAKAASNGAPKKSKRRRRMKRRHIVDSIAARTTQIADVPASLDEALAQVKKAGETILAIRKAARQVFGV